MMIHHTHMFVIICISFLMYKLWSVMTPKFHSLAKLLFFPHDKNRLLIYRRASGCVSFVGGLGLSWFQQRGFLPFIVPWILSHWVRGAWYSNSFGVDGDYCTWLFEQVGSNLQVDFVSLPSIYLSIIQPIGNLRSVKEYVAHSSIARTHDPSWNFMSKTPWRNWEQILTWSYLEQSAFLVGFQVFVVMK